MFTRQYSRLRFFVTVNPDALKKISCEALIGVVKELRAAVNVIKTEVVDTMIAALPGRRKTRVDSWCTSVGPRAIR